MAEMSIGGILTSVVKNHKEVLPFWNPFKGSHLLHVDAHGDMNSGAIIPKSSDDLYVRGTNEGNFICAAIHNGLVDSVHWFNPHSLEEKLRYLGSVSDSEKRIDTHEVHLNNSYNQIMWGEAGEGCVDYYPGKNISYNGLKIDNGSNLILDIDLDAFSARDPEMAPKNGEFIECYEKRIGETIDLLSGVKRPSVITIAKSGAPYILEEMVPVVYDILIKELRQLYD